MLSSLNHIYSVVNPDQYQAILDSKVNHIRWAEYSISAGVMLWIVASLSGIIELRSLVAIAMLNAGLQYNGYLIDKAVAANAPAEEINSLLLTSWGIHMTIWTQIFISFFTILDQAIEIPDAVYSIVFILAGLFTTFGALQTMWAKGFISNFRIVEAGFIILSLSAKTFLTFMTYFGVLAPREDNDTRT